MREYLPRIVGNKMLRQRIGAEIAAGDFSHAYIIAGPHGSGKHAMALQLAMAAACHRKNDPAAPLPCGCCPACRKLQNGLSPDLIRVGIPEDKATIGVDVIRELRRDIALVPNDLDLKFYIIEDAHAMTGEAQNAFLLTLEEPPPFVVFFLLTENADALLETIRSRAPLLRMQPIDDRALSDFLLGSGAEPSVTAAAARLSREEPEEFAILLRLSAGSIGTAIRLLDKEKRAPLFALYKNTEQLCRLLASRREAQQLMRLLLPKKITRKEAEDQLLFLQRALRDLLLLSYSEKAPLLFFTDAEAAAELAACFPTARLMDHIAAIDAALSLIRINGNVRLTLLRLLDRITQ